MTTKRSHAVATGVPNTIVMGEEHILVLVAGTVDPTNLWEDLNRPSSETTTHGRGYSKRGEKKKDPKYWASAAENDRDAHDPDWYWETNPRFRAAIKDLEARYKRLHVFPFHGWTADNAIRNREIAGTYLCDRLCGGGGQKAFYDAWLKLRVCIHLMGHSHGGNVINEFTRRAASSSAWPKTWKIRSVTYLSTPFFPRLHPIDTGAFHPDCTVLNAFNKYDLTQRVVADFNLHQLNGVAKLAGIDAIMAKIQALSFDTELLRALTPSGIEDVDDTWLGVDLRVVMDPVRARALYAGCLKLLGQIDAVFTEVLRFVETLHEGIMYPVALQLAERVCAGREVLSDQLTERFQSEIRVIHSGISMARRAFEARMSSGVYPLTGFLDDLHLLDCIEPLVTFLEIDPTRLSGRFADLLHGILREQLEEFANTTHTPASKLAGTPFASRLQMFDVTKHDLYMDRKAAIYRPRFDALISRLEAIERRYATTGSQHDLLDLLFTLGAQVPALRAAVSEWRDVVVWVDRGAELLRFQADVAKWANGEDTGRLGRVIARLAHVVRCYVDILHQRDVGGLAVLPQGTIPPRKPTDPEVGDLDHFMRVSHSISRDDLYPELRQAFVEQLAPTKPQRRR